MNRGDADRNIVAYYRRNPWNYDCDGYSHMLTYSLRPFETVIIEFATHEN